MKQLPTITLTMVVPHDDAEPVEVTLTIGGDWYDLGTFDTITAAAQRMGAWVRGRGLVWAPGSTERLNHAHRTQAPVLTLEAVTPAEYEARTLAASQAWHTVDVYPYAHVARTMGC